MIAKSATLKIRGGVRPRLLWQESRKRPVGAMGEERNTRCEPRSDIICLEGNGYRASHHGDGYRVGGAMYTLNSTEVHAVCIGVDLYNQTTTGGVSKTLSSIATDADHVPCVLIRNMTLPNSCADCPMCDEVEGFCMAIEPKKFVSDNRTEQATVCPMQSATIVLNDQGGQ